MSLKPFVLTLERMALEKARRGDYQGAIDECGDGTLLVRGCAKAMVGDWRAAKEDFEANLNDHPECVVALDCFGLAAAVADNDWNVAVDCFTKSLLSKPTVRRLCLLARVHCCERAWHLARDRYKDALSIDPQCEMARVGLEQATMKNDPLPFLP